MTEYYLEVITMRKFFEDYGKLCKESGNFYKQHWLGTIVMQVVGSAAITAIVMPNGMKKRIINKVKSKFRKEKEA